MLPFEIHTQPLADCHRLGRFNLCHVLLNKNALLPWFILVPESDVKDLLDLPQQQSNAVINEASAISQIIKQQLGCPKINFAAIGNIVPQLHLHVVGRRPDDPCWPAPVWGNLPDGPGYNSERVAEITDLLVRHHAMRRV